MSKQHTGKLLERMERESDWRLVAIDLKDERKIDEREVVELSLWQLRLEF